MMDVGPPEPLTALNSFVAAVVAKSCPTLYNFLDCCTPGFPVLHYPPDFAQIHVH